MRRSTVLVLLACASCIEVHNREELEEPAAPPVAAVPDYEAVPPEATAPDLEFEPVTHDEPVGPLLLRLKTEPTSWGDPHSFARTDAGRGPLVSLYADGTLIWRVTRGFKRARLTPTSADALHRQLLDLGVGTIPSYERTSRASTGARCPETGGGWAPCKQGGTVTLSDVDVEVWEVALPTGDHAVTRHFGGWAPGHDAELEAARQSIREAITRSDAHAEDYRPTTASLLLRPSDWMADSPPWPLSPALFESAIHHGEVVVILEGEDLATLSDHIAGYGLAHFVRAGNLVEATLVPWLPDHDWRAEVEAFAARTASLSPRAGGRRG